MAATKEQSIGDKLRALHSLQLIDSKMDEIGILKGELPIEVGDLEDEITGLKTRVTKMQNSIAEIDAEILRHITNIKESEALIQKYEKQLEKNQRSRSS